MTGPGWRLGDRYRVVDRLGSGGMAEVFRAHDELLNRDVAVKVFRAPTATPNTAAGVERQRAELHALARLNHPNLITLFDGSIADRPAYLVMELIDGPSLADRIEVAPLPEAEARDIGVQIAGALAYVHSQGMVHRDVKPANILLGTDRADDSSSLRARLSDFGIVRLLGTESMTSIDSTLGTASYLAPEQTRGSGVGPPADIYAFGLTLIETFTGTKSFDGPPMEAVMARLSRDPAVPTSLREPWPALLRAMTAREPASRPTAADVARALRGDATAATAVVAGLAPAPDATSFLPRPAPAHPAPTPSQPAAYSLGPVARPADPTYAAPGYGREEPPQRRVAPWVIVAAIIAAAIVIGGIALVLTNSSGGGGGSPSTSPATRSSVRRSPTTSKPRSPSTTRRAETSKSAPSRPSSPETTPSTPSTSASSASSSSSARTSASSSASSSASDSKSPPAAP